MLTKFNLMRENRRQDEYTNNIKHQNENKNIFYSTRTAFEVNDQENWLFGTVKYL